RMPNIEYIVKMESGSEPSSLCRDRPAVFTSHFTIDESYRFAGLPAIGAAGGADSYPDRNWRLDLLQTGLSGCSHSHGPGAQRLCVRPTVGESGSVDQSKSEIRSRQ